VAIVFPDWVLLHRPPAWPLGRRAKTGLEERRLDARTRSVLPASRSHGKVIATVDTRSWTITLQGKVASQDDLDTLLRVARGVGAGSPSMSVRYQITVDPVDILEGVVHTDSEMGGCLSDLAEWIDISCCKSDVQ
jgi:hypothetical protein